VTAQKNTTFWLILFSIVVIIFFLANLWYGSELIAWSDVMSIIAGRSGQDRIEEIIVLNYRLPQAITALSVGMALSVAGLLLQTIFRNPLAGPSVLGISSGASLGVALLILASSSIFHFSIMEHSGFLGQAGLVLAAFLGALIILALIIFVANRISNVVTVLIIGIMVGYTVSAVVGVLQFFSRAEELHAYVLWGLGSFSKTTVSQASFLLLLSLALIIITFRFVRPLNALLLGDGYARSVGVDTRMLQIVLIIISGILIAAATAFAGPIAFIGLAIPHLARAFFKTSNHSVILPAVVIFGGGLSLACNLVAKLPGFDTSLPINAITSAVGAPVVIWVIVKRSRLKYG
jgi:iron complex transport system permease protein